MAYLFSEYPFLDNSKCQLPKQAQLEWLLIIHGEFFFNFLQVSHGLPIQTVAGAVLQAFKFFIFKKFRAILKKLQFEN